MKYNGYLGLKKQYWENAAVSVIKLLQIESSFLLSNLQLPLYCTS